MCVLVPVVIHTLSGMWCIMDLTINVRDGWCLFILCFCFVWMEGKNYGLSPFTCALLFPSVSTFTFIYESLMNGFFFSHSLMGDECVSRV